MLIIYSTNYLLMLKKYWWEIYYSFSFTSILTFFVPCLTVYLPLNWNLQINFTKGIFWRKIMPFIIFKYLQFNVQVANKTNNYIWCSIVHTTHFFSSGFDLLRSNQLMFPSPSGNFFRSSGATNFSSYCRSNQPTCKLATPLNM